MTETKSYVFKVEMSCEGCSNAITNVLNKNKDKGISKFTVDLKEQKVTVESTMTKEALIEIFKKSGKKFELLDGKK